MLLHFLPFLAKELERLEEAVVLLARPPTRGLGGPRCRLRFGAPLLRVGLLDGLGAALARDHVLLAGRHRLHLLLGVCSNFNFGRRGLSEL